MTETIYFAYGSNMDVTQMGQRCPSSGVLGLARLEGHRFSINSRGVATLIPDVSTQVFGVLWHLASEDEVALDDYEGVPVSYQKQWAPVDAGLSTVDALIYIANDCTAGLPRPRYMERIVAAAEEHGIEPNYLAELRKWVNMRSS